MRYPVVVLLAFALAAAATAQNVRGSSLEEVFEQSNVAASRGDRQSAVAGYRMLVDAGVHDADVFFNLGTVHAQSGDYPRAILNYERALVLSPNDRNAALGLRNAEKALEEARAEAEGEAMIQRRSSMGDAIYGRFTEDALAIALLLANLLFFACLAWSWAFRRRNGAFVGIAIFAAAVLGFSALGLGVKSGTFRDGPRAVALDDRVLLREGPDGEARVRGEARGGDRGEVLDVDRDFVKLRVINGAEGWASASQVGLVDLDERVH
jgi:tetratricopeptide (TPR) repeat protein